MTSQTEVSCWPLAGLPESSPPHDQHGLMLAAQKSN